MRWSVSRDTPEARTREIDVDTAENLEEILLMADVGVAASGEIVEAVRKRQRRGESLRELVKQEMLRVLEQIRRSRRAIRLRRRTSKPARDACRRRQRRRQDDDDRQARESDARGGQDAADLRRRHVPRRRRRSAADLGRPRRRRHRPRQGRLGSGRRGLRRDDRGEVAPARRGAGRYRRAACTRART